MNNDNGTNLIPRPGAEVSRKNNDTTQPAIRVTGELLPPETHLVSKDVVPTGREGEPDIIDVEGIFVEEGEVVDGYQGCYTPGKFYYLAGGHENSEYLYMGYDNGEKATGCKGAKLVLGKTHKKLCKVYREGIFTSYKLTFQDRGTPIIAEVGKNGRLYDLITGNPIFTSDYAATCSKLNPVEKMLVMDPMQELEPEKVNCILKGLTKKEIEGYKQQWQALAENLQREYWGYEKAQAKCEEARDQALDEIEAFKRSH